MLVQRFSAETVLDAARRRIALLFDLFTEDGQIICSLSGGKDSTALLHLVFEEARRRGRRVGVFFLDEEVVYESTVDQVEKMMALGGEAVVKLWLQVEFALTNATSTTEGQLLCWEAGKHKLWMRAKRKDSIQHPPWDRAKQTVRDRRKGFGFYDAIENFERSKPGCAFLVGLRAAGESPNRWRAVTKNPIDIGGHRIFWGTRREASVVLYPLYDWNYTDVWRYIAEHEVPYSRIYDQMLRRGVSPSRMRVSSLIHEGAYESIVELPEYEPRTYARLLKRVKGIALAQETGRAAKLFRCSKLPQNFTTWLAYRDFLLATHQNQAHRAIFEKRFARHLRNEYVARQQVRQLLLGDVENNAHVDNKPDPREELVRYYEAVL